MSTPEIVNWILGTAAVIAALTVIWKQAVLPGVQRIATEQVTRPVLDRIVEVFRDNLNHMEVLDDIAHEFKTNSGSSLKDAMNRLERAAEQNEMAVAALQTQAEAQRIQLAENRVLLDRLAQQLDLGLLNHRTEDPT